MLSKQYIHRLPADYDIGHVRERAARRGPLWDAAPGLGFKAFSHERAVLKSGPILMAKLFFPPYTDFKQKLIRATVDILRLPKLF